MSARQAEVQASICVLLGEKKSLVLSALTMGGKLAGCDSRVEEQRWHCSPKDVGDRGDPGEGRNVCQFRDESLFFGEQTWRGAFEG